MISNQFVVVWGENDHGDPHFLFYQSIEVRMVDYYSKYQEFVSDEKYLVDDGNVISIHRTYTYE